MILADDEHDVGRTGTGWGIAGRREAEPPSGQAGHAPGREPLGEYSAGVPGLGRDASGPLRQNRCRPHRTLNPGAMMEEQVGEIRTSIQGQGCGAVAAA